MPEGGDEPMVRLPSALNAARRPGARVPSRRSPPGRRGRPASTSSGRRPTRSCGAGWTSRRTATGWACAALPDRWVVLRLLTPVGADRRWRCAAGCSRPTGPSQVDLGDWPAGSAAATPAGAPVAPAALDRRRGRRADVGRHLRLGREPLRPPRPARRRGPAGAQRRRRRRRHLRGGGLVVGRVARPARRRQRRQQPRRAAALAGLERGHPVGRHARLPALRRTTSRSSGPPST